MNMYCDRGDSRPEYVLKGGMAESGHSPGWPVTMSFVRADFSELRMLRFSRVSDAELVALWISQYGKGGLLIPQGCAQSLQSRDFTGPVVCD